MSVSSRTGLFIVCVDPWSVGSKKGNPEDVRDFQEHERTLKIPFVNHNPNFYYLLTEYAEPFIKIVGKRQKVTVVQKDGWLRVDVPMTEKAVAERTARKVAEYRAMSKNEFKRSTEREKWLEKTISFLKGYGKVVIVRLPVDTSLLAIENQYYPDFDRFAQTLASRQVVPYFDFTPKATNYRYVDGNHLHFQSSAQLSKELAALLLKLNN